MNPKSVTPLAGTPHGSEWIELRNHAGTGSVVGSSLQCRRILSISHSLHKWTARQQLSNGIQSVIVKVHNTFHSELQISELSYT